MKASKIIHWITYCFIVLSLGAVAFSASYLLIDELTDNGQNENKQAVVINNDRDFKQEINYTATIVHGGTAEQYIEIESIISVVSDYTISFTGKSDVDYSMLDVNITNAEEEVLHDSLDNVIEKTSREPISGALATNEKITYKIVYGLPFEYAGEVTAWDFSININAKGRIF